MDPKEPGTRKWTIGAPVLTGVFFSLLACFWMPWESVHPNDPSLHQSLGYAPMWSHRFYGIAGARVDWQAFGINLAVIWVISVAATIMLSMSTHRE